MSDLLNSASLVMIPSGYKEDVVYSQIPTDGSGDLSFTRASNGTRINSAGLVEVCPWNLVQYSEQFDNAYWVKTNTTVVANSAISPNGTTTAELVYPTTTGSNRLLEKSFTISTNTEYTGTWYLKASGLSWVAVDHIDGNVGAWFNLSTGTIGTISSGSTASIESVGNGWYRCRVSKTSTGSTTGYHDIRLVDSDNVISVTANGTNGVLVWGAQLNIGSTAKPYFPTTDRLNVPRLTYQNGGGGCPSLLLEKQSTNLCLYSEQFDNSAYNKISGGSATVPVVTANFATSPDGSQNADRIQFSRTGTTASDFSAINQSSLTLSATGTTTIYLKSNTSSNQNVLMYWGGGQGQVFVVTPSWQRFTLSNLSVGTDAIVFGTRGGSGNFFNGGDLTLDILAWGAQVEASSYPTSYIPTTSSSATRVADGPVNLSTTQTLTNFTLFYDGLIFQNGENMLFGSGNSAWYIDIDGSTGRVVLDLASGRIYNAFSSLTSNQRFKLAVKRSAGVVDAFVNGTKLTPNTQVTDTTSLTLSSITWAFSSTFYPKMKVNEICAFQSALSDSDCQALTTI
jgi:hypothetical protein